MLVSATFILLKSRWGSWVFGTSEQLIFNTIEAWTLEWCAFKWLAHQIIIPCPNMGFLDIFVDSFLPHQEEGHFQHLFSRRFFGLVHLDHWFSWFFAYTWFDQFTKVDKFVTISPVASDLEKGFLRRVLCIKYSHLAGFSSTLKKIVVIIIIGDFDGYYWVIRYQLKTQWKKLVLMEI